MAEEETRQYAGSNLSIVTLSNGMESKTYCICILCGRWGKCQGMEAQDMRCCCEWCEPEWDEEAEEWVPPKGTNPRITLEAPKFGEPLP